MRSWRWLWTPERPYLYEAVLSCGDDTVRDEVGFREIRVKGHDILLNGKDPAEEPVKTFDNGTATVNTETAQALGLSYDEVEPKFAPFCTKVQPIETAESFSK